MQNVTKCNKYTYGNKLTYNKWFKWQNHKRGTETKTLKKAFTVI